jgi:molybdopterin-guanine dinucleotide biosynthesis protein A
MSHQKHAKIARPAYGQFHRNEWAIIGTPCGKIQQLAYELIQELRDTYRIAYVDADHKHGDEHEQLPENPANAMEAGASFEYTDKINFHRFDSNAAFDSYQHRVQFNNEDLVLVNGNHFKAKHQIVVLDPKKKESLSRKLDRLTDVQLILTTDQGEEPYDFLEEKLAGRSVPVFHFKEVHRIALFLAQAMSERRPILKGLVLAGGKSQRMGEDKGAIAYHGIPQREYAARMLEPLCEETYVSCRKDQLGEIETDFPLLADTFEGLGPFGAILSAFREDPEAAWLVVACDLPLLNEKSIRQLRQQRNLSKLATAFNSPVNEFPEPLIAIWEPRAYPVLLQFLAQGYSCPRKALINSMVALLDAEDPQVLTNVNNPEEKEQVLKIIKE